MADAITLIPGDGDGAGPALTGVTRRVLEATGAAFDRDAPPDTGPGGRRGGRRLRLRARARSGETVTYDLKPTPNDPAAVGAEQFADAVIQEMTT